MNAHRVLLAPALKASSLSFSDLALATSPAGARAEVMEVLVSDMPSTSTRESSADFSTLVLDDEDGVADGVDEEDEVFAGVEVAGVLEVFAVELDGVAAAVAVPFPEAG